MTHILLQVNKRGLSNVVGYVLLISITLSLSVMVYGWLSFYVADSDAIECPEGVSLIINSYSCHSPSGAVPGELNLTFKNNGLFETAGYILRVHNRSDAYFGFYIFNKTGDLMSPGDKVDKSYDFSDVNGLLLNDIKLVEVQPVMMIEDRLVECKALSSQRIKCE